MDYFHLSMKEHTPEEFVNLAKGSSKIAISDELKKRQVFRHLTLTEKTDSLYRKTRKALYGFS